MKKLWSFVFSYAIFVALLVQADPIRVSNTCNQELIIVFYSVPMYSSTADRLSKAFYIPQGRTMTFDRQSNWNPLVDRMLIASKLWQAELFDASMPKSHIQNYGAGYIGSLQGNSFYVVERLDGSLDVKNESGYLSMLAVPYQTFRLGVDWIVSGVSWALTGVYDFSRGVIASADEAIRNGIKQGLQAFIEYPYKNTQASVRVGSTISEGERKAIQAREQRVQKAMEDTFGKVPKAPRISLIASGGGYRAMLCSLGFLTGAQRMGLLDMTTWIAALSGGVWGTMSYLSTAIESKMRGGTSNLEELRRDLINRISGRGLESISTDEFRLLSDAWLVNATTGQSLTIVDIYGALLANQLLQHFGDNRQRVYLWQFAPEFEQGWYPIPLLTTVQGEEGIRPENLAWYEYNPWEMRGPRTVMNDREWHFAPLWALGRNFYQGQSVDFELCRNLGYMYGACGSAFAATIDQILDEAVGKVNHPIVRALVRELDGYVGQKRLTWAEIYNFTRGMTTSPMKDASVIKMVDAGLSFNLPYPAVSGELKDRMPDILIFLDASATIDGAPELRKAENYARSHGLKFPRIDYAEIDKRAVSVFKDITDPTIPVVIYLPRINEVGLWDKFKDQAGFKEYAPYVPGFDVNACVAREVCSTFNFNYSASEALRLSKLMEFNILTAQDVIMNEIKQRAMRTS